MEIYKNLSIENLPGEEWKDIKNYEGLYQVSNMGRIKTLGRKYFTGNNNSTRFVNNSIKSQNKDGGGYLKVTLSKDGDRQTFSVHRLVATTFIDNPDDKTQVNHIDECKTNNIVQNLSWVTPKENSNYGTRNKRIKATIIKNNSFTFENAINHRKKKVYCETTGEIFESVTDACKKYNIKSTASICACCSGKLKSAGKLPDRTKLIWKYL